MSGRIEMWAFFVGIGVTGGEVAVWCSMNVSMIPLLKEFGWMAAFGSLVII